jgi:hypothetical protein
MLLDFFLVLAAWVAISLPIGLTMAALLGRFRDDDMPANVGWDSQTAWPDAMSENDKQGELALWDTLSA